MSLTAKRNPDRTRENLLQAGFDEIWQRGFRSADVNRILDQSGLTKGALYHHFGSKKGLGYAVLDEVVRQWLLERWIEPLQCSRDPIATLIEILEHGCCPSQVEKLCPRGCPLNNLTQEMSPLDDGFRERIHSLLELWRATFVECLVRGQEEGTVRPDLDAESTGTFLLAACQGVIGLVKGERSGELFLTGVDGFIQYLESLRPAHRAPA